MWEPDNSIGAGNQLWIETKEKWVEWGKGVWGALESKPREDLRIFSESF